MVQFKTIKKIVLINFVLLGICWNKPNRFQYNRWQRRISTLSVQLYSDLTSDNNFIGPTKFGIIVIILK